MCEAPPLSLAATQGILGLVVGRGRDLGAADVVAAAVRAAAHAAVESFPGLSRGGAQNIYCIVT